MPIYKDGNHRESQLLYSCYKKALELAKEYKCHSIAFPLISAGIFGYPKDKAWRKALQVCNGFINDNSDYDIKIVFTIIDDQILKLGFKTLDDLHIKYN